MTVAVQMDLLDWKPPEKATPRFDGATYDHDRDHLRLSLQLSVVFELMRDGLWRTPEQIVAATGVDWASAGARIRDCKKQKFGGHTVQREYVANGVFRYRLIENTGQR